jgi:hypothetical protein
MANLAECWGWMPDHMDRLSLPDLMAWQAKAIARRPKEK